MTNPSPPPRLVPDRPSDAHVGQAFREVYIGGSQSSTAGLALAVMHRARTLHDAAAPPAEAPGDKEHGGTYLFSRPGPCAAPAAPAPVPADVMAALDRMCTPLDPSWIKGATMKRDAECMAIIRDYILSAPRVTGGREEDGFNGDNAALIESMRALVALDEAGALVPNGIGGHARTLLTVAASRLEKSA